MTNSFGYEDGERLPDRVVELYQLCAHVYSILRTQYDIYCVTGFCSPKTEDNMR